jgi:transcription-repair coupling factor (superfamily II helicase)
VVLLAEGHGSVERFVEELAGAEVPVVESASLDDAPRAGLVTVTRGRLQHGVDFGDLVIVTEADVIGQRASTKDMRRLPSRRRRTIS